MACTDVDCRQGLFAWESGGTFIQRAWTVPEFLVQRRNNTQGKQEESMRLLRQEDVKT